MKWNPIFSTQGGQASIFNGFIKFVDNAEMGESRFIFRNEVTEGSL
jgi:hypothetical protein